MGKSILCLILLPLLWSAMPAMGAEIPADNIADQLTEKIVDEYHRLERAFDEIPDGDTMDQSEQHIGMMASAARRLLFLEVDGKEYQAESVYFTRQPEGYVCRLLFADDTIHTTEFPLSYPKVPLASGGVIQVRCPAATVASWPVFYTGDPGQLHGDASRVNICHPDASGRFTPSLVLTKRDQLIFTITKDAGDLFFRKYVWVIEPR